MIYLLKKVNYFFNSVIKKNVSLLVGLTLSLSRSKTIRL